MTKVICDICGKEDARNQFSVLCHLASKHGMNDRYMDSEGNLVSQRPDTFDLCNKCYNLVAGEAMKKLNELKRANNKVS